MPDLDVTALLNNACCKAACGADQRNSPPDAHDEDCIGRIAPALAADVERLDDIRDNYHEVVRDHNVILAERDALKARIVAALEEVDLWESQGMWTRCVRAIREALKGDANA